MLRLQTPAAYKKKQVAKTNPVKTSVNQPANILSTDSLRSWVIIHIAT